MLLTAYPAASETKEQMRAWLGTLDIALDGIKEDYVQQSVKDFIAGKVDRKPGSESFRPSIADIAAYARTLQAREYRHQAALRENQKRLLPPPEWKHSETEQQRRAHVQAVLGRKVEYRKTVNPPAMLAEDCKRPKPWHDKAELQESMGRINDYLNEQGVPLHPKEADFIDKHNPEDAAA